jgi:hypothetical protein
MGDWERTARGRRNKSRSLALGGAETSELPHFAIGIANAARRRPSSEEYTPIRLTIWTEAVFGSAARALLEDIEGLLISATSTVSVRGTTG